MSFQKQFFSFFWRIFALWRQKIKSNGNCKTAFWGEGEVKSRVKCHISPYLDNEFSIVARISRISFLKTTSSQMWLIPPVDDRQSTLLKDGLIIY
jgi:hypothetical protein